MPATFDSMQPHRRSAASFDSAREERKTLLVVSDGPPAIESLVRQLGSAYHIIEVSDPSACLRYASATPPDAVLIDARDERASTAWLTGAIRGFVEVAAAPIVVLSARRDGDSLASLLRDGADDVLGEPWSMSELNARLTKACERKRLDAELNEMLRARDDVLAQVAHDLRGPLNTIALCSEALAESASDERSTGVIQRAAARMASLIDGLLAAAHSRIGEPPPLQRTVVSPMPLIEVAVAEHQRRAQLCGVSLTARGGAGLPDLWADAMQVQRVLGNLIDNAIKFTGAGGAVEVRADCDGDRVIFSVRDTGPGITIADQRHVFDRRWQKRRDDRGLGLGLAIAKTLVEAHHGTIWVKSALGRGATFFLSLPALL